MSRKKYSKNFDAIFSVALPVNHIKLIDKICERHGIPRACFLRSLLYTCLRYHEFNHKYHNPPPPQYFRLYSYIEAAKGGGLRNWNRKTRTVVFWINKETKEKFVNLCQLAGVETFSVVFRAIVQLFIEEILEGRSITEAMYTVAVAFDYWLHYHR